MENVLKTVTIDREDAIFLNRVFQDYKAKQDILTSVFELHKFDDDNLTVQSPAFLHYEQEFAKAKFLYDETMKNIQEKYVPKELQEIGCKWEVDFNTNTLKITRL